MCEREMGGLIGHCLGAGACHNGLNAGAVGCSY